MSRFYGATAAVDGVDLSIMPGEFLTLLGPSGSGKTTLLMLLAGFERPSSGTIRVAGRDLNRVPPNRRDQGIVFQSYALFPHMTARENLAYPLDARGIGGAEKERLIGSALERVRMSHLADRMPAQLSGGQQQRIALARAIVFNPPLLLMDESLSALDRGLREEMQVELKILHEALATTIVYVTHDQREALTMSDRIAIMRQGRLVQLGTPKEIYDRPVDSFVAGFIGECNFVDATVASVAGARLGLVTVDGSALAATHCGAVKPGDRVRAMIRPEAVELSDTEGDLAGEVTRAIFVGGSVRYWLSAGGLRLCCNARCTAGDKVFDVGESVRISISADDVKILGD